MHGLLTNIKIVFTCIRIIPLTPLLEENGGAEVDVIPMSDYGAINIAKLDFTLTSLNNSQGIPHGLLKDGQKLHFRVSKNTRQYVEIRPEEYIFLRQNSKCQKESYYECIGSELDQLDYQEAGKDLFDRTHNPSHSTLYADVLKKKQ